MRTLLLVGAFCILCICCATGQEFYCDNPTCSIAYRELYVVTDIVNHFATTRVEIKLGNRISIVQQAEFIYQVPTSASIRELKMKVGTDEASSEILTREDATLRWPESTVSYRGVPITVSQDTTLYKIAVQLRPHQNVTFTFTYDELLTRKDGEYEYKVNLNPGSVVDELGVVITVLTTEIGDLATFGSPSHKSKGTVLRDGNRAQFIFAPDVILQEREYTRAGIAEDLIVRYSLLPYSEPFGAMLLAPPSRDTETQEYSQYFVHYWEPAKMLLSMPKSVVFVIDTCMMNTRSVDGNSLDEGSRLAQIKLSITTMLATLDSTSYFSVVAYSNAVKPLDSKFSRLQRASSSNVGSSISNINGLTQGSCPSSGIGEAIETALEVLNSTLTINPMVVVVSASRTTSLNPYSTRDVFQRADIEKQILEQTYQTREKIRMRNTKAVPIYVMGMGYDIDYHFLRAIALENNGLDKRIDDAFPVSKQMLDFWSQISSIVYDDLILTYRAKPSADFLPPPQPIAQYMLCRACPSDNIRNVTTTEYARLFRGTEVIAAGRLASSDISSFSVIMEASSASGVVNATIEVDLSKLKVGQNVEKIWRELTLSRKLTMFHVTSGNSTLQAPYLQQLRDFQLKHKVTTAYAGPELTTMYIDAPETTRIFHYLEEKPAYRPSLHVYRRTPENSVRRTITALTDGALPTQAINYTLLLLSLLLTVLIV